MPLISLLTLTVPALPADGHAAAPGPARSWPPRVAASHAAGPGHAAFVHRLKPEVRAVPRPAGRAASADAPVLELVAGPDRELERCRYLHRRIEHFTRLRRSGGSGAQMERWRRSRQRFEEEYRHRRCYRFGRRLKPLR